jgi:hypothetical protein
VAELVGELETHLRRRSWMDQATWNKLAEIRMTLLEGVDQPAERRRFAVETTPPPI